MKCIRCNTDLENDAIFCSNCGADLRSESKSTEKIIRLGRSGDNDIVIKNPNVSSHHAQLRISGDKVLIEDLNSSNGIFVNNRKVLISVITSNDIIQLSKNYVLKWNDIQPLISTETRKVPTSSKVITKESIQDKITIKIGRTNENDIVLNNIKVSRQHARLNKVGNDWHIEDLGSSNGTFVNGIKIKNQIVNERDLITIGGIPLNLQSLFQAERSIEGNVRLSADKLTFSVNGKTIIDDISLNILPGEFVGLIGPSGAGKTTLMLMMNGVVKPSSGNVYINSQSLFNNFESFKGQIGYVPQDDIIHRELKVHESLEYTARLRFNSKYSDTEITSQVDNVIETLDLGDAKNTLIGTPEKKGISGGQRKRVNLGQELLTEPSILFLDEPTSGLDPKTDMDVMNLLRDISLKGRIVVLTTHNITEENFDILTSLVVLTKGGKLAYFGPSNVAVNYFGVKKPYQIFDTLNSKAADYWKNKYRESIYYDEYILKRQDREVKKTTNIKTDQRSERKAGLTQFFTLTERYLKIKLRDRVSTLILLLQAPIIAFLISIVFSKADEKIQALFVLVIAAIWLGCSNAAREIVSEQSIYKRERMVNLKIPSYLSSKILVLSFLCMIQSAILAGLVTPVLSLEIGFIRLFLLLLFTSFASLSIGLLISSMVNTSEASMALIPIILIPQVILGGLISKFGAMSEFIKGLSALMISRWSFEASLIGEFSDNNIYAIESIGFSNNNLLIDFSVILFFSLFFFILTSISLRKKD